MIRRSTREPINKRVTPIAVAFAIASVSAVPGVGSAQERSRGPDDASIVTAVSEALQNDQQVFGYDVRVQSRDGIVTLRGTAGNLLAKERAANVALSVRGVQSVVNNINVVPDKRSDIALRDDIKEALLANPRTESYEVRTSVERGFVTLKGEVQSWQERRLAGNIAKTVKGVKGVINRLDITYPVYRSDAEITGDVKAALKWDRYIDERFIVVDVNDRRVDLAGTVGSAAEKERVIGKSWVTGVDEVDAGSLKVRTWARDEHLRQTPVESVADAELKTALNNAYNVSAHVSPFAIEVGVDDGVVTLNGRVDNLIARRKAERIAEDTVGVNRVQNRIAVATGENFGDDHIRASVANALIRDPYVERFGLDVQVDDGVVALEGTVDNVYEKTRAQRLASGIKGVLDVDNRLTADGDGYLLLDRAYYTEPADDVIYDWHEGNIGVQSAGDDALIKSRIQEQLWWSPFVDSHRVNVNVENGVASLSGKVDDTGARQAAVNNAFEGGAVDVINLLEVSG